MKQFHVVPMVATLLLLVGIVAGAFILPRFTSQFVHAQSSQYSADPNCVAFTTPVLMRKANGKSFYNLQVTSNKCYATYAQAIFAATGGKVKLLANMKPGEAAHKLVNAAYNSSSSPNLTGFPYIELFQNSNYGGQNITYSSASSVCTSPTVSYGIPQIGTNGNGFNMNDQTSSYQTFGNCKAVVLFQAANYNNTNSGSVYATGNGDVPLVNGVMNDQASSLEVADNCTDLSDCLMVPPA